MTDIWQRLVTRDIMSHGQLELLDRAADEIARLRDENELLRDEKGCCILDMKEEIASLTAEVMHLRGKLDHIAQCTRWDLEPP